MKIPVEAAEYLLKSPYTIAPGPEAEVAIPIIEGLLLEVDALERKLRQIAGLCEL